MISVGDKLLVQYANRRTQRATVIAVHEGLFSCALVLDDSATQAVFHDASLVMSSLSDDDPITWRGLLTGFPEQPGQVTTCEVTCSLLADEQEGLTREDVYDLALASGREPEEARREAMR